MLLMRRPLLLFIVLTLTNAATARADLLTFTSRPQWEAAVAGNPQPLERFFEDFQRFSADVQFRTQVVNVGPFTLGQQRGGLFRNFIDVPPLANADNNGTAHASMYTDFRTPPNIPATTVAMTFTGLPLVAWGADFFGAAGGEGVNLNLIDADGKLLAMLPVTVDTGFFGFVADAGESVQQIVFRSRTNLPGALGEGFGLDNVSGAIVPEPSTFALAILAVVSLAGFCWRPWRCLTRPID